MNWDAIGAIGEIIGAAVVAITVAYLAYQTRQASRATRAEAQRDLLHQLREWWHLSLQFPELFDVVVKGLDDWRGLQPNERNQFNAWAWSLLNLIEQAFFVHRDGFANEPSFEGLLNALVALTATPGGSAWWAQARDVINDDVSSVIDLRIAQRTASSPDWYSLFPEYKKPAGV